jgi:hypothetical protein
MLSGKQRSKFEVLGVADYLPLTAHYYQVLGVLAQCSLAYGAQAATTGKS